MTTTNLILLLLLLACPIAMIFMHRSGGSRRSHDDQPRRDVLESDAGTAPDDGRDGRSDDEPARRERSGSATPS